MSKKCQDMTLLDDPALIGNEVQYDLGKRTARIVIV